MPVAFRKGVRKEPWGKSACASSSTMSSASKPVRQARARVVVRPAFRDRAARRVALEPPRLQIADHDPFAAEIDAPEQSAAGIQGAAPLHAIVRPVLFRVVPGPLDNYGVGHLASYV